MRVCLIALVRLVCFLLHDTPMCDSPSAGVTDHGEWWRMLTSTFSHLDVMHVAFNMMSMLQVAALETVLGSMQYVKLTFLFVVLTSLLHLGVLAVMLRWPRWEHHRARSCHIIFKNKSYSLVTQSRDLNQ